MVLCFGFMTRTVSILLSSAYKDSRQFLLLTLSHQWVAWEWAESGGGGGQSWDSWPQWFRLLGERAVAVGGWAAGSGTHNRYSVRRQLTIVCAANLHFLQQYEYLQNTSISINLQIHPDPVFLFLFSILTHTGPSKTAHFQFRRNFEKP